MRKVRFAMNETCKSAIICGCKWSNLLTFACRRARHFEGVEMRTSGVSLRDKLTGEDLLDEKRV